MKTLVRKTLRIYVRTVNDPLNGKICLVALALSALYFAIRISVSLLFNI